LLRRPETNGPGRRSNVEYQASVIRGLSRW
jgi:hypothetical protein